MNPKQRRFFNKPRTMQEVTALFNGDEWAANEFQSVALIGRQIEMIEIDGKLHFIGCKNKGMKKIATLNGYNYFTGNSAKGTFYNIVPIDQQPPKGGYYSKEYILQVKGLPDMFK